MDGTHCLPVSITLSLVIDISDILSMISLGKESCLMFILSYPCSSTLHTSFFLTDLKDELLPRLVEQRCCLVMSRRANMSPDVPASSRAFTVATPELRRT